MVTLVQGASGDMWVDNAVGMIRPVAYKVVDGNDKCIGGLYKHEDTPWEFSQSFGSIAVSDKGNLTHQDIQIIDRMMTVLNEMENNRE